MPAADEEDQEAGKHDARKKSLKERASADLAFRLLGRVLTHRQDKRRLPVIAI